MSDLWFPVSIAIVLIKTSIEISFKKNVLKGVNKGPNLHWKGLGNVCSCKLSLEINYRIMVIISLLLKAGADLLQIGAIIPN